MDEPLLQRPVVRCLTKLAAAEYLGIGITTFDALRLPAVHFGRRAACTTELTLTPGWTTISSEGGPERRLNGP